jgi:hypothetical protein
VEREIKRENNSDLLAEPPQSEYRVPVPPSAEKTNRPAVKRMWRVPTPLQKSDLQVIQEEPETQSNPLMEGSYDEEASSQSFQEALKAWRHQISDDTVRTTEDKRLNAEDSLLHGEYDPQSSHESFLEALNQWRSGPTQDPRPSTHEGQQTEMKTVTVQFEQTRSYLDQLTLKSKAQLVNEIAKPEIKAATEEKPPTPISEPQWDDEDELMFLEILSKRTQSIPVQEIVSEPSKLEEDASEEELEMFKEIMDRRWVSIQKASIEITDVTENEDDEILNALNQGRMVECIPSSKLKVIEME